MKRSPSYQSVLNTVIPDRGFDFSSDYEVNNALGIVQYSRSRQEEAKSAERLGFLRETAKTFRKTIAIDSENVGAHYGLGLAYAEIAGSDDAGAPKPNRSTRPGSSDEVNRFAAAKTPADRAKPAAAIGRMVAGLLSRPRAEFGSRLNPLQSVAKALDAAIAVEADPAAEAAIARTLATTHKALHAMYKPDETAEGRAIGLAVKDNPAAEQNARSVVIHPLHRPGAPGIDPKPVPVAARESR